MKNYMKTCFKQSQGWTSVVNAVQGKHFGCGGHISFTYHPDTIMVR